MLAANGHILRRLEASGYPLADLLKDWKKPVFDQGSGRVLPEVLELHDLLNFIARSAPAGIGFELGLHWSPDDYGPYGNVLRDCVNLTEVSSVLKCFQTSLRQPSFFADSVLGDEWIVEFAPSGPFGPGAVVIIDELLARTKYEIEQYTGETVNFKRLELSHKAPLHKDLYYDHFQCPISFGKPKTVVHLSIDYLHQPLDRQALSRRSRPITAGKSIFSEMDLSERVMLAILETLVFHPGTYPGMQQVADMFGTSTSTLKRMLSKDDVNYRALVDLVRQEHVVEYLALTTLSPKEIAYRIGFTNVNNFRRAFHRWMAMTPNEFRQSICSKYRTGTSH